MSGVIRKFISRNPATGQIMKEFPYLSNTEVLQKIKNSQLGFKVQSKLTQAQKQSKLVNLGKTVEKNVDRLAKLISLEMGKPLAQSLTEVQKSANHCYYYADNLPKFLKEDLIKTEAKSCYIRYEPLGTVFLISPFNFPMWLIFKGGIANLAMGNSLMVRCSNSNPQLGVAIEEVMLDAGYNNFEYQNVFTTRDQTDLIMSNPIVQGVSFTGSSAVGAKVAQTAGKYVKKSVMELGGSDPFIVLKDVDVEYAVNLAVRSRVANCGQVCLCAKRFIVAEEVYDDFVRLLKEKLSKVVIGDPLNEKTQMGPLVRADARDTIEQQVAEGLKQGGILRFGGKRPTDPSLKNGFFYEPTLVEVKKDNILFTEETFGPIFPVCKVKTEAEMIEIANNTEYGLGAVVVSKDVAKGEEIAKQIQAGMVFVNEVVKSDSRVPSGGVKFSGYGRECCEFGIKEFTNVKLIWTN